MSWRVRMPHSLDTSPKVRDSSIWSQVFTFMSSSSQLPFYANMAEFVSSASRLCVMDGPFYFTDSDQTRNPYRLGPREFTQTITCARLLHVSVIFQAKRWVFQRSQDSSKSADEALISNKLQPSSFFGYYQRKWPIVLHCLWNITTKNKILSKTFPKENESLFTLWVESLDKQINPH